jgi:hypothetical protein
VYFVWISEQTAIISLYSINWLFFLILRRNIVDCCRGSLAGTLNGLLSQYASGRYCVRPTRSRNFLGSTANPELVSKILVAPHASSTFLWTGPDPNTTIIPNVQACNAVWSSINVPNLLLTVIIVYQTTRCQIIEDDNLRTHRLRISNLKSTMTVNSDYQQQLSAVAINCYCRQWLSTEIVHRDCQQWLSTAIVSSDCEQCQLWKSAGLSSQQWVSTTIVSRILKSAVTVNRDCKHGISTTIVSRILKSTVTVNLHCQHRVSTTIISRTLKSTVSVNSINNDCQ